MVQHWRAPAAGATLTIETLAKQEDDTSGFFLARSTSICLSGTLNALRSVWSQHCCQCDSEGSASTCCVVPAALLVRNLFNTCQVGNGDLIMHYNPAAHLQVQRMRQEGKMEAVQCRLVKMGESANPIL